MFQEWEKQVVLWGDDEEVCLHCATLEHKLGEIDRACAESILVFGANGTLSRSRQGLRTPSERCCGSDKVCKLNSLRRLVISLHKAEHTEGSSN